jgi:hypothetical protein
MVADLLDEGRDDPEPDPAAGGKTA